MDRTISEHVGAILLIVGAAMVVIAGVAALDRVLFSWKASQAEGVVVRNLERLESYRSGGGRRSRGFTEVYNVYAPIIEYKDGQGGEHQLYADTFSRFRTPVGSRVPVLYLPTTPHRACVGGLQPWVTPILIFAAALAMVVGGAYLLRPIGPGRETSASSKQAIRRRKLRQRSRK